MADGAGLLSERSRRPDDGDVPPMAGHGETVEQVAARETAERVAVSPMPRERALTRLARRLGVRRRTGSRP
ncbi:MAG: hypothetical protein ACRDOH_02545 [Streptosporangiaceae bacterium]